MGSKDSRPNAQAPGNYAFGLFVRRMGRKLGGTITKSSPVEFVRAIIPFICYPINSLEDEKYRPTPSLILKDEDIANLSESDIEEIARIYVVNNEDLSRSHIYKDRNDEDGKIVKYLEYADVKYPKKYDENYVHYLHRLLIIQENYYREQREELKTKSLRYTNFSQRLRNDIFKTFNLGESLRGTLPVTPASTTPDFPHMDNITEIIQTNEETRLRPYRMLSEKLEHLIDKSDKTVEFLVSMNLTQT